MVFSSDINVDIIPPTMRDVEVRGTQSTPCIKSPKRKYNTLLYICMHMLFFFVYGILISETTTPYGQGNDEEERK